MINALMGPILGIADKVLDRAIPDKGDREKAKLDFAKQVSALDSKEIEEVHNCAVTYGGAAENVHPSIQVLRGSVRPLVTYFLIVVYAYGFLHPSEFTPEIMQGLFQLNLISLAFWFGERAMKNLGLNLSKKRS